MTIFITLSLAGTETGPFDLYSNVDGFTTPFDTGVSRAALLAGYETTALDGTITVRLDDLNALCTPSTTDIYTCAIPNCDFSGEIICPVTTTTTSTSSSTTTTSTLYPGVAPCTWSTYGGNPGEIAVYDFDTNLSTAVLVPNDFTTTQGINRPICSTGDKLWLASVLVQGDPGTNTDDVVYIREWDINNTGPSPTLSYVRQITVLTGTLLYRNTWGTTVSAIAVTADNNTLIVGFGDKIDGNNSSMGVYSWDISTAGNITLNESNRITKQNVAFAPTFGVLTELTGMFITNNNNVIISVRYYENQSPTNAGNYIKEFVGLPPVGGTTDWLSASSGKPIINLQTVGVPEFTTAWTNPSKAMPVWGVNGLLQVIQPETLGVYNISQTPNYAATLATTVADNTVWIHTSTGCANVEILNQDEIDDCTPTALPILVASNGSNYIGPITFTYSGMSVIASSNIIGGLLAGDDGGYTTDCGITIPASCQVMHGNTTGATLNAPAFNYTLEFPVPVNNIALRTAILNPLDDFRFTTNVPSTTITMVAGCRAAVQNGNELITGLDTITPNDGSAEVVVTGSEDFTILTFVGTNKGNGGPWALGCTVPPLDCRLVYSTDSAGNSCSDPSNAGRCLPGQTGFKKYFAWDVNTNTQQEVLLPPGTATGSPNFALSENYIIVDVTSLVTGVKSLARYGYTDVNGIPSNTTFDGQFIDYPAGGVRNFGSIMEAVSDTKFLGTWQQSFASPFPTAVSQILEWDLSGTTLSYSVKIDVGVNHGYFVAGDLLLTFKTDGTPNKIIAMAFVPPLQPDNSNPGYLLQFDYTTNALDGTVNLPAGVRGSASITIYDGGIYIGPADFSTVAPEFAGVWRCDLETLQWTQLDPVDVPVEMGLPSSGPGDFAATPVCRVSDGFTSFDPIPTTTTTTTTIPEGINTIWTWFEAEIPV
jgi:hypothetical protein